MRLTIKSKTEIETMTGTEKPVFEFWMRDGGGYVYLESAGHEGTTGQQICRGGAMSGDTVSASPSNFEATCRRWYRQYMRAEKTGRA